MLVICQNLRKIIGLAFEINNAKAFNICFKGTMFLYLIMIEKTEIVFAQ